MTRTESPCTRRSRPGMRSAALCISTAAPLIRYIRVAMSSPVTTPQQALSCQARIESPNVCMLTLVSMFPRANVSLQVLVIQNHLTDAEMPMTSGGSTSCRELCTPEVSLELPAASSCISGLLLDDASHVLCASRFLLYATQGVFCMIGIAASTGERPSGGLGSG